MFLQRIGIAQHSVQQADLDTIEYKGLLLDTELRLDVLVEDVLCCRIESAGGFIADT
jgi:hypothetical protein